MERKTIDLPDDVYEKVRKIAFDIKTSPKKVMEYAIIEKINETYNGFDVDAINKRILELKSKK